MINISTEAKNKISELMKDDGYTIKNHYVRVGVKSGGCSGLSYDISFAKEKKLDDKIFNISGINIIVNKKSFPYLVDITLDYSGGLNGKGLIFKNPNAQRTCGCGESFSL